MRDTLRQVLVWPLFFAPALSFAQVDSGTLTGTVTDPAGSVIADAAVAVTNDGDGATLALRTNHDGIYTAPSLKPGHYSIRVEGAGFQSQIRKGVDLRVQDRLALNFTLAVSGSETTVEVTGDPPQLETETSSLGHVVEHDTVQGLPLNGRNVIQLATLAPGTTPSQRTQERNTFISNGQRSIQNSYLLDGIDNKNKIVGFDNSTAQSIEPIVDAVEEFKVQTSTFSAEFGQSAGAVVNATIRSGTDRFHGSVFEFFRNSALDTMPYFQPNGGGKPLFQQNQYGATLGGPAWKQHSFFFFAWQGSRVSDSAPQLATVPTDAQKNGQFATAIYDPATTVVATNGSATRTQFVNNSINPSRYDAVAAKLLALYPEPNQTGSFNFFSAQKERVNSDQYIGRVDQRFGERDSAFARYIQQVGNNILPAALPPPASNPSIVQPEAHSFVGSETHVFSPTLVNEAHVGYQETREQQHVDAVRLFDAYGIQGAPNVANVTGLPTFAISGLNTLGTTGPGTLLTPATGSGNLPIDKQGRTIQITENLSWQRGRHSLRFGFDAQQVTLYAYSTLSARPTFNFNGAYTQNPLSRSGTGNAFADFLLGYTSSSTVSTTSLSESRQHIYQGFVQDDWKASRRLTLNVGLRYELPLPFYETANHYSNLILESNANFGKVLNTAQAAAAGYRRSFSDPNYRNFAPRLGFAYQPHDGTVVRSAFGIFYGRDENVPIARRPTNNPPYFVQTNYTSDQVNPGIILAQGFPADAISAVSGTPAVNSYPKDFPTPYVEQWSLSVQQQLPAALVLQVSYVGSGTHRLYYPLQIDQPTPGAGNVQSRRPLPQYSAVYQYGPFISSNYHSLQSQLERRFTRGLYLLAAYTWAHSIDNGGSQVDNGVPAPQDARNLGAERGDSNFDVRNRFVFSSMYDLPFGRDRAISSDSRIVNALVSGWTAKAIFSVQGGLPFTPVEAVDQSNTGTTARPNRTGSGVLADRNIARWFDTAAFSTPAQYTFGNSGRDILRGPGFRNFDLALSRTFPVAERVKAEFRAEAFNALNTPQFGLPNATLGQSTTAAISSVVNPQREVQLALRLAF